MSGQKEIHIGQIYANQVLIGDQGRQTQNQGTPRSTADAIKPPNELPENINALLKEGGTAFNAGRFEEARNAYENALNLAEAGNHVTVKIRVKVNLAAISWYWDREPEAAKQLLETCLEELRNTGFDAERADVLFELGTVMGVLGDFDQAQNLLRLAMDWYRKLGRKLSEAATLVQLGWEIGYQGTSDETLELNREALDCYMTVYHTADAENRERAIQGIAHCYFQRAMVYKREAKVEEAETALMSCLEWQRKIEKNHELAKILRELAGLKFHERDVQQGCEYLKEAREIYSSLGLSLEEARCLDMIGRLLFTLGKRKQASSYWAAAATAAEKAEDGGETAEFLFKLGQMQIDSGNLDDAKQLLERARDAAGYRGDDRARCLAALARVAEMENEPEKSRTLLKEAIASVKKFLPTVQAPPRRAELLSDIGTYHQELEEYSEALTYFQRSKEVFESISNLSGTARTLGIIAHLKGRLGRVNEEREVYVELRKLVEGTPHYDIIAVADINLAEFEMRNNNLAEAKRLLKSAETLCRKYQLPYLQHVVLSLDHVESALAARRPPHADIDELIDELYDQLHGCPQNKDGYLRYWVFSRSADIVGNLRGSSGLHFHIIEDSLDSFQALATKFSIYADWSLLVVPSKFPENVKDWIPVTNEMRLFQGTAMLCVKQEEDSKQELAKQALASLGETTEDDQVDTQDCEIPDWFRYWQIAKGGTLSRYIIVSTGEEPDKNSELTGYAIVGWSPALPQQFHQLVFQNDAEGFKKRKMFFMYYNRGAVEDGLLWDLRLGKEFQFLPVYSGSLPHSEKVQLVTAIAIKLPVFSDTAANVFVTQIRKVKQCIQQLLSCTKDSATHILNQLSADVANLIDEVKPDDFIDLKVYLLEWSDDLTESVHPAMVVRE